VTQARLEDARTVGEAAARRRRIDPWTVYFSVLGLIPVGLGIWGTFAYSRSMGFTIAAFILFVMAVCLFFLAHWAEQLQREYNTALLQTGAEIITLRPASLAYRLSLLGFLFLMPEVFLWAYDFPSAASHGWATQQKAFLLKLVLWGVFAVLVFVFLMSLAKWLMRDSITLDAVGLSISNQWSPTLPWREIRAIEARLDQLEIALVRSAHPKLKKPPFTWPVTLTSDRRRLVIPAIILPVPFQDFAEALQRRLQAFHRAQTGTESTIRAELDWKNLEESQLRF
jgi:hypothetical protein